MAESAFQVEPRVSLMVGEHLLCQGWRSAERT